MKEPNYFFPELNELADSIVSWRQKKGFETHHGNIPEKLMLIVSELAEALEAHRDKQMVTTIDEDGKPVGFPSELADTMIRLLDLSGSLGYNIAEEIDKKMQYNEGRPLKHDRNY